MLIKIHVDSMKDAERLSAICREHSEEILLRADHFCVDPKSTLGVLAIMYSARDSMQLDTGDMGDIAIKKFIKSWPIIFRMKNRRKSHNGTGRTTRLKRAEPQGSARFWLAKKLGTSW